MSNSDVNLNVSSGIEEATAERLLAAGADTSIENNKGGCLVLTYGYVLTLQKGHTALATMKWELAQKFRDSCLPSLVKSPSQPCTRIPESHDCTAGVQGTLAMTRSEDKPEAE
eukprot:1858936-Rhodomonas_salina.1